MGLFELVRELINEHGSSTVLRERLLLLQDKAAKVEEELRDCKARLAEALEEQAQHGARPKEPASPAEYVEYRGAAFKRKFGGGYDDCPVCPRCFHGMASVAGLHNYRCVPCDHRADFTGTRLPQILREMQEKGL